VPIGNQRTASYNISSASSKNPQSVCKLSKKQLGRAILYSYIYFVGMLDWFPGYRNLHVEVIARQQRAGTALDQLLYQCAVWWGIKKTETIVAVQKKLKKLAPG
jgi:hypothetical protein